MIQRAAFVLGVLLLLTGQAAAQPAGEADPPGRVGRLALIEGPVSLQPAGASDWAEALPNRPLTAGDRLWTGEGGRAEVQTGGAAIRLGEGTFLEIVSLDDVTTQLRLTEGTLLVRLRRLEEQEAFEVGTPTLVVTPQRPGEFRVEAPQGGASATLIVRGGSALVTGAGQAFTVNPGQRVRGAGADPVVFDVALAPDPDELDAWARERDRATSRLASSRYVSPGVVGVEDLDAHGAWQSDPDYGAVWVPRAVPVGWAPYRFGEWVWIDPWGWTWVDEAPWGFAPFHYGRWAYRRTTWVWVPGPIVVRPVYAPALVAWVAGDGFSVSVSFGGPAVAWFPLAPFEVYVPAYRASRTYVTRVNVTNTVIKQVNITRIYDRDTTIIKNVTYRHHRVPGAVSALPRDAFGRPGQGRPSEASEARGGHLHAAPPVPPSAESRVGRTYGRQVVRPPQTVAQRPVLGRLVPPPRSEALVRREETRAPHGGRGLAPVSPPSRIGRGAAPTQAPRQAARPADPPRRASRPAEPPRQAARPAEPPRQGARPAEPPRQAAPRPVETRRSSQPAGTEVAPRAEAPRPDGRPHPGHGRDTTR